MTHPCVALPTIALDIWFHADASDLHRVLDLLPSLEWRGTLVGLRIEFAAVDETLLLTNFRAAREKAQANIRPGANGGPDYHPLPPKTIQTFAGHSSLQVTMDRYGHLFRSDSHGRAMDAIASEIYAPNKPVKRPPSQAGRLLWPSEPI